MENLCGMTSVTWEGDVWQDPDYAEYELLASDTSGNSSSVRQLADDVGVLTAFGPHADAVPSGTTRAMIRFNHNAWASSSRDDFIGLYSN